MLKFIKYSFLSIFFLSCTFTPEENYYNGIKSITQYMFYVEDVVTSINNDGEIEDSYVLSDTSKIHVQNFDDKGKLIEDLTYSRSLNRLSNKKIYEYHSNGSMAQYKEFDGDLNLIIHYEFRDDKVITYYYNRELAYHDYNRGKTYNYSFNSNGKITSVNEFIPGSDTPNRNYIFEYDNYDNITSRYYYKGENLVRKYIFTNSYDDKERLSEINYTRYYFGPNGIDSSSYVRQYSYNTAGYIVDVKMYTNGQYNGYAKLFFNNQNQLTRKEDYNDRNNLTKIVDDFVFYEDYKILLNQPYDSTNTITSSISIQFKKDNLKKVVAYNSDEERILLSVFYNKDGNVIEYITADHFSYFENLTNFRESNIYDSYYRDCFLYNLKRYYFYNNSDFKFFFERGHYKYNNYDKNNMWETMIKCDDHGDPAELYIQEYEKY